MCPTSFEVRLSPGERNRLIFWQEPTFTDNVAVEHVYKTRVRGTYSYFISLSIFKFSQFFLIRKSECVAGKSFYFSFALSLISKLIKSLPVLTIEHINIE